MRKELPLVSVVIITYNSADTILETLDSVKQQSYEKIELIISDDCSSDNTIPLIEDWINNNEYRFVRAIVLKSLKNTGVCANFNRAIDIANGEWIKGLAGDDIFEINAIEEYVRFVLSNQSNICFAKMKTFGINEEANKKHFNYLEKLYKYLKLPTREQQYKASLKRHILPGPGIFYRKDFWNSIGRFNEKYPFAEEYDFQLRVLNNSKIDFLDQYLIDWRIRPNSLSNRINPNSFKSDYDFFYDVKIKLLMREKMYLYIWHEIISLKIKKSLLNGKRNYRYLYLLSPIWLYNAILKKNKD